MRRETQGYGVYIRIRALLRLLYYRPKNVSRTPIARLNTSSFPFADERMVRFEDLERPKTPLE
jgi:hypothetical protein